MCQGQGTKITEPQEDTDNLPYVPASFKQQSPEGQPEGQREQAALVGDKKLSFLHDGYPRGCKSQRGQEVLRIIGGEE